MRFRLNLLNHADHLLISTSIHPFKNSSEYGCIFDVDCTHQHIHRQDPPLPSTIGCICARVPLPPSRTIAGRFLIPSPLVAPFAFATFIVFLLAAGYRNCLPRYARSELVRPNAHRSRPNRSRTALTRSATYQNGPTAINRSLKRVTTTKSKY